MKSSKVGNNTKNKKSSADILLRQLSAVGVDYLFANGGTDFPPLVEAYSSIKDCDVSVPQPMVVPHEAPAVAMAHGYFLATGQMQAVMVHVNVGTANTINTLLDASREHVPILLMAGRSPFSEKGHLGTRTRYIHWAQEMFDQAGMLREAVKWDYELHLPDQTSDVIIRAAEIAQSSPKGPVYLTLPRDVLAADVEGADTIAKPRPPVMAGAPTSDQIAKVAQWLLKAERPLIITSNVGASKVAFLALSELAEAQSIPVVNFHQRFINISSDHPMNGGHDPAKWVPDADLILVLEADVPWIPSLVSPADNAKIVHIGEDPIYSKYPMRSFPSDISIATSSIQFIEALSVAMGMPEKADVRREWATTRIAKIQEDYLHAGREQEELTPEYISRIIGELAGEDAIIVNEYPLRVEQCQRTKPGTYMGLSPAGGLGWGFGAALGIKLADRKKTVIATLGDGAYIFCNPTACHWVSEANDLPILTVIFNNALHGAVRNSTLAMYPDGVAAKSGGRMLADLSPSPAFETLAGTKGHGEKVTSVAELKPALKRALAAVADGNQALVNVICDY